MANIIFQQGKQAKLVGRPLQDNPYQSDTPERRQWYLGWCEGNLLDFMREHTLLPAASIGASNV